MAMHTVTVTCEYCDTAIQCPVLLTAGKPTRNPVTGNLIVPVNVRVDPTPVAEHRCPGDDDPDRGPAAIPAPRAADDREEARAA